jgi:hypothetical protein
MGLPAPVLDGESVLPAPTALPHLEPGLSEDIREGVDRVSFKAVGKRAWRPSCPYGVRKQPNTSRPGYHSQRVPGIGLAQVATSDLFVAGDISEPKDEMEGVGGRRFEVEMEVKAPGLFVLGMNEKAGNADGPRCDQSGFYGRLK